MNMKTRDLGPSAAARDSRRVGLPLVLAVAIAVGVGSVARAESLPETSFDGMTLVESSKTSFVYRKADVDLADYDTIQVLPCQVAFRKGWAEDFNREQGSSITAPKVSEKDMERIKATMAGLFDEVFRAELAKSDSYAIVSEPTTRTVQLRPAIINLHVVAPVLDPAVRSKVLTAGEGTLYLELYDAVSGEILARIVDREQDPERPFYQWATRAFNKAAAQRIMEKWATQLRVAFDEAHEAKTD